MVLAGRPGMGKTALATNIAYNIAASYESEIQADGSMKVSRLPLPPMPPELKQVIEEQKQ